jgi:hypothetical protein
VLFRLNQIPPLTASDVYRLFNFHLTLHFTCAKVAGLTL